MVPRSSRYCFCFILLSSFDPIDIFSRLTKTDFFKFLAINGVCQSEGIYLLHTLYSHIPSFYRVYQVDHISHCYKISKLYPLNYVLFYFVYLVHTLCLTIFVQGKCITLHQTTPTHVCKVLKPTKGLWH